MSSNHPNNFVTFVFLTLLGSGLYLLLTRRPAPPKKTIFPMDNPAPYMQRERMRNQAILKLAPHSYDGSIISLN